MVSEPDLQPLSEEEIETELEALPGWKYKNDSISKQFEFDSFSQAIGFVTKLAPFCEEIVHHPDMLIQYKKITFTLSRFDVGGKVTERDFTVAKKIEELYAKRA